ncbi:hypothetical protein T636_A3753 [Enterobacter hormaechei subsp. xiangfangensis]|nr:hypothetical protein T636_A3753 [Enterobacter hormaechei subsp. xiangfangensis]RAL74388.1 hypothetical protein CSC35_2914 [Enterobacter hormaechei]
MMTKGGRRIYLLDYSGVNEIIYTCAVDLFFITLIYKDKS